MLLEVGRIVENRTSILYLRNEIKKSTKIDKFDFAQARTYFSISEHYERMFLFSTNVRRL